MTIKSLKQLESSSLGEDAKRQIREAFKKNGNRTSNTASNLEQPIISKPLEEKKNTRFINPVCIDIFSTRKRQTDNRAISEKAVVDALVKTGILKDDRKENISRLSVHEPEISEEEKTIIVIEEL